MRHWPPIVCTLLLVGCAGAPAPQAPVPIETAPVAVTPTPVATATATPTPTPSPSVTPTASPSPDQLTEVPEATHGPEPFPSPLKDSAIDLKGKTVAAGAGNATARGAIDGDLYTQWSSRQEMADNVWWSIDLGNVRSISRLDLLPDADPEVRVLFDVEVSDDYKTWKSAGDGIAYASNQRPRWGSVSLPAGTTGRFVRIVPKNWGRSWVAIWEVRMYP